MGLTAEQRERQQVGARRAYALFMGTWTPRKAAIEGLYLEQGFSQQTIADSYGVQLGTIQKAMRRLGIPSRSRGRKGKEHYAFKDGKETREYRTMVVKTWCERCMKISNLCIHHRNNDYYDNRPENLAVYCQECHQSEHKKAW